MNYKERWRKIDRLGEGGQGQVFSALDLKKVQEEVYVLRQILGASRMANDKEREYRDDTFRLAVLELVKCRDTEYLGALKILHTPNDARDPEKARDRIRNEIDVMSNFQHPGIIKILDKDPNYEWYVSRFCRRGHLAKSSSQFNADLPRALSALRPIIEAVAKLHESGYVHRDIKPENIFLKDSGELALGDFGLIFFDDVNRTRLSATYDNVGSRDWMPGWATGMRVEEIEPNFDVFCLGKTLWSMLSSKPVLRLWYFDRPEFDLVEQFPGARHMKFANQILAQCVVEEPTDCLPDAGTLLEYVDNMLVILESGADFIDKSNINEPNRLCKACGLGYYKPMESRFRELFGLERTAEVDLNIFLCQRCGNVEFFAKEWSSPPDIWR